MKEENRTRSQLIKELAELRQRVAELEKSKTQSKHAQDLFETLFLTLPIGIYIAQDGKFQVCNPLVRKALGYSLDELLAKDPLDLVLPEDRNRVRENRVKMLKGELSSPYEYRLITKSGEIRWVMETIAFIRYQGKQATLGNLINLTKVKQLEEKLREREAQYRGIFSSATDSFVIFDLKGNIVEANPQACTMHGYAYNELIKLSGKDIVHPDYFYLFEQFQKDVMAKGEFHAEAINVRKDGTPFNIEVRGTQFDYRGEKHLLAIVSDITERKQAAEVMRQSEEKYRQLFEYEKDAITIVDLETLLYLDINPAAEKLYGYTREELLKMKPTDTSMEPEKTAAIIREFASEREISGGIRRHKRKDGGIVTVENTFSSYVWNNRKVLCAIGRDITERILTEEKLQESERRFKELSITDGLTKLYNSRYFYEQLESESKRALRYNHPLSLLLFDIDNFKFYNDTYGHLEGDTVLDRFGKVIRENLRATDSAYRYGGEEFTVILPETSDEDALKVAERIREGFGSGAFSPPSGKSVTVTVSGGVAQYDNRESLSEFIRRADESMYLAKKRGKNRIAYLPGPPSSPAA